MNTCGISVVITSEFSANLFCKIFSPSKKKKGQRDHPFSVYAKFSEKLKSCYPISIMSYLTFLTNIVSFSESFALLLNG